LHLKSGKKSELSEGVSEIWLLCHPFLCTFNAGSLDQLQPAQVFHLVGLNVSVAVRAPRTCLSGQRENGKGNRAYHPPGMRKPKYINYMELFGDEIHVHVLGRDTFTSHTSYFLLRHAISWNHQVGTWWKYRALSQGMRANLRGQQNPSSMQHEEESVFSYQPANYIKI